MGKKELIKALFNYDLCKKTAIDKSKLDEYKDNPNYYVATAYDGKSYLCKIDDDVNTMILFQIFKCVNFIKNVVLAGLVCGGIGIGILLIILL